MVPTGVLNCRSQLHFSNGGLNCGLNWSSQQKVSGALIVCFVKLHKVKPSGLGVLRDFIMTRAALGLGWAVTI